MVASVLYNVSAEEEKNLASGIVSLLTGSTLLVFDVGISVTFLIGSDISKSISSEALLEIGFPTTGAPQIASGRFGGEKISFYLGESIPDCPALMKTVSNRSSTRKYDNKGCSPRIF
jgi:hypothetical protein